MRIKSALRSIPLLGPAIPPLYWRLLATIRRWRTPRFRTSSDYWERRYAQGGTSGAGSQGKLARFKADVLNTFIAEHDVTSVIEHGCGDGTQLQLIRCPRYLGVDVSATVVHRCRQMFSDDSTRTFKTIDELDDETAELAVSLDVIYHLVEDHIFEAYMTRLFRSSRRYVVVYSTNVEDRTGVNGPHVRHRRFSDWVDQRAPEWTLLRHIPNVFPFSGDPHAGSAADFFFFEKTTPVGESTRGAASPSR